MKVRPKEREQNCFFCFFNVTICSNTEQVISQRSGEGRSPELCHRWPSTSERSLQVISAASHRDVVCVWQYGDRPGVAPVCVCAESAAPGSDIWACSSVHSQLYLIWIWLVSSRRSGPRFTSAVSRHICPSFQEPRENAPSHNCLTFW